MSQNTITCRTLRELDALVAEHVMGLKPPTRPGVRFTPPNYTTWAGVEEVIRNRESAGYKWGVNLRQPGQIDEYYAEVEKEGIYKVRYAQSAPVAFCLATLASVGVRVKLEVK